MQVTSDFYGSEIYQYRRYYNSIQAITGLLANGITLHFDYHEGFTEPVTTVSREDVIVLDPRDVTLGSCTETYSGDTYTSTYGIRLFAGRSHTVSGNVTSRSLEAYLYVAPWFVVQVLLTSPTRRAVAPLGTFFVDTVIYPDIRYIRTSSRYDVINLSMSQWPSNRYYTDKYRVYEFTYWPRATDADRHATIAELGSLT
jgi:hypothetical protein